MKVSVFFEAPAGAHLVAQFDEESTYIACLPALEKLAESCGYVVTESVDYEALEATEGRRLSAEERHRIINERFDPTVFARLR